MNTSLNNIIDGNSVVSKVTRLIMIIFFICFVVLVIYYLIFSKDLSVEGQWKCRDYDANKKKDPYYFEMSFGKKDFVQKSYSNSRNDIEIKGTYIRDEERITITTSTINGVNTTTKNYYDYEFSDKDTLMIENAQSYVTYYCIRVK